MSSSIIEFPASTDNLRISQLIQKIGDQVRGQVLDPNAIAFIQKKLRPCLEAMPLHFEMGTEMCDACRDSGRAAAAAAINNAYNRAVEQMIVLILELYSAEQRTAEPR